MDYLLRRNGKVQIAHQAIDSLGWPAMTMWCALRGSLPQDFEAGDAVRFELAQENGKSRLFAQRTFLIIPA